MKTLTEEQKRDVVAILALGCDRETAAKYAGLTAAGLDDEARRDADFAVELRRAEAGCELGHMRVVQQAAREEKQWRASLWWLERRAPDRYAKRDPGLVTRRELARFLNTVAGGIAAEVRSEEDRQRVLDRLAVLAEAIGDPLAGDPAQEHVGDKP
ncbi:MAG: hypothetical protein ACRCT8_04420 [Lacipirellulaceae bacterium]